MKFALPQNEFTPHPEGRHTGVITEIRDEGPQETPWGEKHKISIRIVSDTALLEDGQGALLVQWFTLSGHERATLSKFRCAVADRALSAQELADFDSEELEGQKIRYRVDHKEGQNGQMRAYLREGSVEPVEGSTMAGASDTPDPALTAAAQTPTQGMDPQQQPQAPPPSDDDLPFS